MGEGSQGHLKAHYKEYVGTPVAEEALSRCGLCGLRVMKTQALPASQSPAPRRQCCGLGQEEGDSKGPGRALKGWGQFWQLCSQ